MKQGWRWYGDRDAITLKEIRQAGVTDVVAAMYERKPGEVSRTTRRRSRTSIAPVIARISEIERKQLEEKSSRLADQARNEERFDTIFRAMDGGDFPPQKDWLNE